MDPYSKYKKQQEYYEHFQHQLENPIDLANQLMDGEDPNNTIRLLAKNVFSKNKNNLDIDLSGAIFDESMETADIFCMLTEFILYGLHIRTNGMKTLFDITDQFEDLVFEIKTYIKTIGFDMFLDEPIGYSDIYPNMTTDDYHLYEERADYYHRIVPKPINHLCPPDDWYVLNYRMIPNKQFSFTALTPLDIFRAYFVNKNNKVFTIKFTFAKHLSNSKCG
jgi:hypothetical protein